MTGLLFSRNLDSDYQAPYSSSSSSSSFSAAAFPFSPTSMTAPRWRGGLRPLSTRKLLALIATSALVLMVVASRARQRQVEETLKQKHLFEKEVWEKEAKDREARDKEKAIYADWVNTIYGNTASYNGLGDTEVGNPPKGEDFHWKAYDGLKGFFNGVQTLIRYSEWVPEQKSSPDTSVEIHPTIPIEPVAFEAFSDFKTATYLKDHYAIQPCFLDDHGEVPVPDVYAYPGIPANMTAPYWGSYEELGLTPDMCWDRFGRFGSYGYSYGKEQGGFGLEETVDRVGADTLQSKIQPIDYERVEWGKLQKSCVEMNKHRFNNTVKPPSRESKKAGQVAALPRTAYILRSWTGMVYTPLRIMTIRALINELSLKSGGLYDVHLLVHVKDETLPIWASEEVYQKTLRDNVPQEFWDITTLWSVPQMQTFYPGPFPDELNFENDSGWPIYTVYRVPHFVLQWFALKHPEYEYFWNWEMDVRYSGHYFEFHNRAGEWADKQPRKLLWERNERVWIPSLHGSYDDFKQLVANETDASQAAPVWGPVKFPVGGEGMLPHPHGTEPPRPIELDNYEWGVGEPADLITFNPLFDPSKTEWCLRNDVTGYSTKLPVPPRRTSIITIGRYSRRLLETMHAETWKQRHTMFPEMWPGSVALHHGLKAVYIPHPVYFDRKWPLDVMDRTFNHPATAHDSVYSFPHVPGTGEHNFLTSSFYYSSEFSGELWRRWLGVKQKGAGGFDFERFNTGRMCLRGTLHHPVKFDRPEDAAIGAT